MKQKKITIRSLACCLCLSTLLTGCNNLWLPFVYRPNVHQGNTIEQDNVDKLRIGMTERQVRYLVGNPVLRDPFNPNRWDYVHWYKDGGSGDIYQSVLTVYFEEGRLVSTTGDVKTQINAPSVPDINVPGNERTEDPDVL